MPYCKNWLPETGGGLPQSGKDAWLAQIVKNYVFCFFFRADGKRTLLRISL